MEYYHPWITRPYLSYGWLLAFLFVAISLHGTHADEIPAPQPEAAVSPPPPQVSPESIALFRRGIASLQTGKLDEAILTLRRAVNLEPKHADYHLALASAYMARRRTREAWGHAREAATLDPQNGQAAETVLSIWQTFDQAGLFNVGASSQPVTEKMGEPDERLALSGADRWLYAFMAVNVVEGKVGSVMDLRGLRPDLPLPSIGLQFDWRTDQWQLAHRVITAQHDTVEYVPTGTRIQEWEQLVTIERLFGLASEEVTVDDLAVEAEKLVASVDKKAQWQRIDGKEGEAWFQAAMPKIEDRASQWEVTRIFADTVGERKDFVRLTYLSRQEKIAKAQRARWAEFLKAAKSQAAK